MYPVERLLSDPAPLYFLEHQWDIPFEVLMEAFYHVFEQVPPENYDELDFSVFVLLNGGDFQVTMSTGESIIYKLQEEGFEPVFAGGEAEAAVSQEVFSKILEVLRETLPDEWKDDFTLLEIPKDTNNFLVNDKGDCWSGTIYRCSDPDVKMKFEIRLEGEKFNVNFL